MNTHLFLISFASMITTYSLLQIIFSSKDTTEIISSLGDFYLGFAALYGAIVAIPEWKSSRLKEQYRKEESSLKASLSFIKAIKSITLQWGVYTEECAQLTWRERINNHFNLRQKHFKDDIDNFMKIFNEYDLYLDEPAKSLIDRLKEIWDEINHAFLECFVLDYSKQQRNIEMEEKVFGTPYVSELESIEFKIRAEMQRIRKQLNGG